MMKIICTLLEISTFASELKKLIIILMAFLYVTSVSGVTISRHYCGGRLSSVKLSFLSEDHSCACGSKKMKKGCCKDQHVQVKVKGEHKIVGKLGITNDASKAFTVYPTEYKFVTASYTVFTVATYRRPPPRPNNSLLILNSIFRI